MGVVWWSPPPVRFVRFGRSSVVGWSFVEMVVVPFGLFILGAKFGKRWAHYLVRYFGK